MKQRPFGTTHCADSERVRDWFNQSPGRELLLQEKVCLDELLPSLFGYYLLQLGQLESEQGLLQGSRIRHNIVLDLSTLATPGHVHIRGDAVQLPVRTDSVDVVLMPHTLDFSPDPHQVLREVERVLIPEGRLIILGFNPWSLWGLWRMLWRRSSRVPWCGRFLGPRRINDWLSLLGFDLERTQFLMHRPPLKREGVMRRLEFLERMGQRYWSPMVGVYMVQAVKRVSTLTPIKQAWKARPAVLGGRVVEPTTRNKHKHV
jgi:SAM-dependent methyltransferase